MREWRNWQTRQIQALVLRSKGSSPFFRTICSNSSVGQNTRLIIVKSKVRFLLTAPICGFNSAGRVSDLHSESHRFEPCNPHHFLGLCRCGGTADTKVLKTFAGNSVGVQVSSAAPELKRKGVIPMQKSIEHYKNRISILEARDPVGNRNIINKLTRKVRNMEKSNAD